MLFAEETISDAFSNWATFAGVVVAAFYFLIRLFLQKTHQRLSIELHPIIGHHTDQKREKNIVALECIVKNEADVRIDFECARLEFFAGNDTNPMHESKFEYNLHRKSSSKPDSWSVDAGSTIRLLTCINKPSSAEIFRFKAYLRLKWSKDTYIAEKIIIATPSST